MFHAHVCHAQQYVSDWPTAGYCGCKLYSILAKERNVQTKYKSQCKQEFYFFVWEFLAAKGLLLCHGVRSIGCIIVFVIVDFKEPNARIHSVSFLLEISLTPESFLKTGFLHSNDLNEFWMHCHTTTARLNILMECFYHSKCIIDIFDWKSIVESIHWFGTESKKPRNETKKK